MNAKEFATLAGFGAVLGFVLYRLVRKGIGKVVEGAEFAAGYVSSAGTTLSKILNAELIEPLKRTGSGDLEKDIPEWAESLPNYGIKGRILPESTRTELHLGILNWHEWYEGAPIDDPIILDLTIEGKAVTRSIQVGRERWATAKLALDSTLVPDWVRTPVAELSIELLPQDRQALQSSRY